MLTVAYLNTFTRLRTGPGKFFVGSWKVWMFLSVKEPCIRLLHNIQLMHSYNTIQYSFIPARYKLLICNAQQASIRDALSTHLYSIASDIAVCLCVFRTSVGDVHSQLKSFTGGGSGPDEQNTKNVLAAIHGDIRTLISNSKVQTLWLSPCFD